uniref:Uncharacterized protein n=1 Tax=Anguilla anguilla TaxID=7936 RepID=A0A0E9XZ61_ANGAN
MCPDCTLMELVERSSHLSLPWLE